MFSKYSTSCHSHRLSFSAMRQTWLKLRIKIWPEPQPDMEKTSYWITLMKLTASSMLSAAIKWQYSSVLPSFSLSASYTKTKFASSTLHILTYLSYPDATVTLTLINIASCDFTKVLSFDRLATAYML